MLKQRIITASILFVLFLAALFGLPAWGWALLVLAVIGQGAVEWARLSGLHGAPAKAYWLFSLALMAAMVLLDHLLPQEAQTWLHLACYIPAVMFWVFVVPAWLISGWQPKNVWFKAFTGWAVLLPTGLAMLDLRASSPWLLLFVMTVVMMADISAYFAGKRFGKTKLAPAISPGKTWEGVYGAMAGVALYVLAVWWLSGQYKHYPVILGVILTSWWWVALSVIGDLFESALKRQAGIKDSGALLPGHGGLLDRIDALTSTLPFAGLWLILQRLE